MDELARLLRLEHRLLELLLFKLVEGKELLADPSARLGPDPTAEVERAVGRVQEIGLLRSMAVSDLAGDLGIPGESPTLSSLARDSDEPYRTIFAGHRLAFLELAAKIEEVTRHGRRLDDKGARDGGESISLPSLDDFLR